MVTGPVRHAFHRFLRQRLGIGAPFDGHGTRAADVAEQNGRFHAARTIRLQAAELAEGVNVTLFAEILDLVVALGFAVHQHVQKHIHVGVRESDCSIDYLQ